MNVSNPGLMAQVSYDMRVVWAIMRKDIQIALRNPIANIIVILLPLNFLILELLFAISGGLAPTAVVMLDTGPHAQQFVDAMRNAHSFELTPPEGTTAADAKNQIQAGNIVAVVTIPADFDAKIDSGQPVSIPVTLNNLNVDFTNDIRRALPLTITQFYAKNFPNKVVIQAQEIDLHAQDTDYIPYLVVSVFVISLILGGLLQAGGNAAQEYEANTIKELLLSPASRWAIQVGKVLGALAINVLSAAVILLVIILIVGVRPDNWLEVIVFSILVLPIFSSLGILAGTLLRKRQAVIPLCIGLALPLFFISGAFGPSSFGTDVTAAISQISPAYYGIAVFQHAWHGFITTPYGIAVDLLALLLFAVAAILLSTFVLRRTSLAK